MHPHALSNRELTDEMRAVERAIDGDVVRMGGNALLEREQASIRRWMELRDEQRRREAFRPVVLAMVETGE